MKSFILFKNAKIHYNDFGKGEPIVLLHGFLENLTMWDNFIPILSKKNRIITIDLLGHGKSDCIGYIHSMELMAEAVEAVLQSLKVKHAIIIGHSMGGYVTLALLEKNPHLLKAICLANSTAVSDSKEKKNNRERAIKAVKENHKTFVRLSIANLFRPKNRTRFKEAYETLKQEALKTSVQSIIASLEGMKIRKDRLNLFINSNIPKLVILGKKDAILSYEQQKSQYENTDIKTIEFPDGHMSHIENYKEFTYRIMHFIENI
jgi:pimeloyl-ACP methyl ester carboxylesterase